MKLFALLFFLAVLAAPAINQTKKPAGSATPRPKAQKPVDDIAAWEKVKAISEPTARLEPVRKFLVDYPKSALRDEAIETLAKLRTDIGNAQLVAGDLIAASDTFKAAATEAPKPIPAKLFAETFSKFSTNLFFRGAQLEAYEIAKILEDKAADNVEQLLSIASFYVSAELGADARRVALRSVELAPASVSAHQMLGLAHRMQFDLEASHAAFEKAVTLDPSSVSAKQGLAASKRALGQAEEAAAIYREILERDSASQTAKTGLILALFDSDKRAEAESLLADALKAAPDDVVLLAGVAYWYASRGEGDRAVELGQKAVAANPRYVWSHIALGRGLMAQKKFIEADQAFVTGRRYGNFPSLEYEIASARASAGLYREAADILEKTFTLSDGQVETMLGGNVKRSAATLPDLVAFERRASIFSAAAADDPAMADGLRSLLEFRAAVSSGTNVPAAAEKFVAGSDKMRLHRRLFAATELLRKNVAVDTAVELLKPAPTLIADALDVPNPSAATTGNELYSVRLIAATNDRYLIPPTVSRPTLESILRGQIDHLQGWAMLAKGEHADAVSRLTRAAATLPANSAWWRNANWRLGNALEAGGKNEQALEAYYKGYVGSMSDPIKYAIVESLYKRVRGDTNGLEQRIGPNPIASIARTEAEPAVPVQSAVPVPEPTPSATPESAPVKAEESAVSQSPSPTPEKPAAKPLFEPVVITIPDSRPAAAASEVKPCTLTFSEENVTLKASGNGLSFVVGIEGGDDLSSLTVIPSNESDIEVRREAISGIKGRALFILKSISSKVGEYTIRFAAPCGQRELKVKVT
jgi:tetratricopeptide (TPR) repeat protein